MMLMMMMMMHNNRHRLQRDDASLCMLLLEVWVVYAAYATIRITIASADRD